jgi:hypothetical protein
MSSHHGSDDATGDVYFDGVVRFGRIDGGGAA